MIKNLISLANSLDSKGLVKEADHLDRIIRKYSEDASGELSDDVIAEYRRDHPARKFVLNEINKNETNVRSTENKSIYTNPTNLFAYLYSKPHVIEEGIVFNDNGAKLYFQNNGSGTDEKKKEVLETIFPGITKLDGIILNKDNIYSLHYETSSDILTLVYDELL